MFIFAIISFLLFFASPTRSSHPRSSRRSAHARLADNTLSTRAAATLPSGWSTYVASGNDGSGCYSDAANARVLSTYLGTGYGLTSCLNACQTKGAAFAGLEYGSQCYCSQTTPSNVNNAPSSSCSYACWDSSSKCGGYWKIQVYQYTTPSPSGWALQGCVSDGAARALTGYSYTDSKMTVDKCTSTCALKGFELAGVEYGSQCYCGHSIANGVGLTLDSAKCSSTCGGGGSSGQCGGSWTLSLYKSSASQTINGWTYQACWSDATSRSLAVSAGTAPSVSACLAACQTKGFAYAGVEYGGQCWCDNKIQGGSKLAESACSSTCRSGGSACGGSWALSVWKLINPPLISSSSSTFTSKATSTSSSPTSTPTASSSGWTYLYCATDADARALTGADWADAGMTVNKCLAFCKSKSFNLGGVEAGSECWCGSSLQNGQGQKVADSQCDSVCKGDSSTSKCGGNWKISLWSSSAGPSSTSVGTTSKVLVAAPAVTAPTSGSGSYQVTNAVPSSGSVKYIWAHLIVGNTYPYTYDTWMSDIKMASAAGIDGFALNLGPDSWQPVRVADAYNAAKNSGTGFKMMLSFDMTEFSCGGGENLQLFKSYLDKFINHDAAAKVEGKSAVTTFAGQDCTFGQGSTNAGWNAVFGQYASNIYWMPAFNNDVRAMGQYNLQSLVSWGSAWPTAGEDIETSRDTWFVQNLQSMGKKYVGTLSPLFFSHLSYKNYLWRGDDWLYSSRWEQLISMRGQIDQIEIVSWNDYGESTYIGPVEGDMPSDAKLYANPNFPHTDILSLNLFYATAWKTGKYPLIIQDKVWVMARPHPAWANAWGSPYGPPDHRDYTQDNFYAQVHLTASATVTLCSGGNCKSVNGSPGINRFSQPMSTGQGISVQVVRNGQTTVNLKPTVTFDGNPQRYNFNYLIKSS